MQGFSGRFAEVWRRPLHDLGVRGRGKRQAEEGEEVRAEGTKKRRRWCAVPLGGTGSSKGLRGGSVEDADGEGGLAGLVAFAKLDSLAMDLGLAAG